MVAPNPDATYWYLSTSGISTFALYIAVARAIGQPYNASPTVDADD